MRQEKHKPTYPLNEVKEICANGIFALNGRSARWIRNHLDRFDTSNIVKEIVAHIKEDDFYKSVSLDVKPGTWADVYRFVFTDDDELDGDDGWYVKLFVDESDRVRLHILSANWEGYPH